MPPLFGQRRAPASVREAQQHLRKVIPLLQTPNFQIAMSCYRRSTCNAGEGKLFLEKHHTV